MKTNEIRFYRLRKGITQGDLAKLIGVSQQAVAKWEAGKASVSVDLIPKIESTLGLRKENLFPDLRSQVSSQEDQHKILSEKMEYMVPHEVVFHFKSGRPSYWAEINKANYRRVNDLTDNSEMGIIWFETIDNLIVAINRKQISSFEIGRDFGSLPEKVLERQKLGEIDDEVEVNGDDRLVRLFIDGFEHPFQDSPDTHDDGPTLMMILSDALGDLLDQEDFVRFDYDHDDDRTVYFRPDRFELVECPLPAFEEYMANMQKVDEGFKSEDEPEAIKKSEVSKLESKKRSKKTRSQS